MAYGIEEFPHTSTHDYDLWELLKLMRELRENYDRLLKCIEKMETTQKTYPAEIQKQVKAETEKQVASYSATWTSKFNQLKFDTEKSLSDNVQTIESEFKEQELKWEKYKNLVSTELLNYQATTTARVNKLEAYINDIGTASLERDQELRNEMTVNFSTLHEENMTNVRSIMDVNEDIKGVKMSLENTDKTVDQLAMEVNEINGKLRDNSGTVTNPITGETESTNTVIGKLYYSLIHAHYPLAGDMDSKSPITGKMDTTIIPLNFTETDAREWYNPMMFNPITGEKQDLQGILSALTDKWQQLENKYIAKYAQDYSSLAGKEYGDMKLTTMFMHNEDGEVYIGKWRDLENTYVYNKNVTVSPGSPTYTFELPELNIGEVRNIVAVVTYEDGRVEESTSSLVDVAENKCTVGIGEPRGQQANVSVSIYYTKKDSE